MDNTVLTISVAKTLYTKPFRYTGYTRRHSKDGTIGEQDSHDISLLIQKLWEEMPT